MTQKKTQKSQTQRIVDFLLKGGSLTPMQALRLFDCWALSSRISEIRKSYAVKSELIKLRSGKVVSRYSIPV